MNRIEDTDSVLDAANILIESRYHALGDNLAVNIIASGDDKLLIALALVFRKAEYYSILNKNELILYWSKPEDSQKASKLPFKLNTIDSMFKFVSGWLENVEYPKEPSHDGSNYEGWHVSTGNFWGHVNESHYSICSIKPEWIMCGK